MTDNIVPLGRTQAQWEALFEHVLSEHVAQLAMYQEDLNDAHRSAGLAWRMVRRYKSRVRQLNKQLKE